MADNMGRPSHEPRMLDGVYELVGKEVAPFDVALSHETAYKLYDFVTQSFLPAFVDSIPAKDPPTEIELQERGRPIPLTPPQTIVPKLGEDFNVVQLSSRIGRAHFASPDLDTLMISTLRLTQLPDQSWKLRSGYSRLKFDGSHNRFGTFHSIDVIAGEVMQAKRRVKILRGNTDAALHELIEDSEPQSRSIRKAFEVQLTDDGCDQLQTHLQSVMKHCVTLSA